MTSDLKFKWWPLLLCCSTSVGYIASAIIASISHLYIRYTITINLNLGAITSITNQFSHYLHRCIMCIMNICAYVCIGLRMLKINNKISIHTNKIRYCTYKIQNGTVEWFLLKKFNFFPLLFVSNKWIGKGIEERKFHM